MKGSWEGHITSVQQQPEVEGKYALVSLRLTSMGNALMHEIRIESRMDTRETSWGQQASRRKWGGNLRACRQQ
jgi:hypothetical protein